MKRLLSVFLVMITGLFCTSALAEDDHKRAPDAPGAAVSEQDSDKAAIRVRVNGSWFGTYLEDYKGQDSVWVPVNLDISKLTADSVNYFSFSSNVINQGDYTDSSIDLFASKAAANLNSFACAHQYCDSQFTQYTDRNINVRLELFDGSSWVTATPQEDTYYDFHEVLGLAGSENQWHNAARNLSVGSLDGYTAARIMVQLHVGSKLDVIEGYEESDFAAFLTEPGTGDPGTDKPDPDDSGKDQPGTDDSGKDQPDTDKPKTGDRFFPVTMLLLSFAAASLCALLGLTAAKKREKTK